MEQVPARGKVSLSQLPDFLNDVVYTSGKYPCLVDESGMAMMFLKYRSRVLSVMRRGDMESESLRIGLLQCMHNGGWLCLDFDTLDYDVEALFKAESFPLDILSPHKVFLEETYQPLLRGSDEFAARVLYENLSHVQAAGAFQDRTKAHAPERVADVNSNFDPQEAFRLVFICKREPPSFLLPHVGVYDVSTAGVKKESAVWAGGEPPKAQRDPAQVKLDSELLECAFEGDIESVKKALQNGADPYAVDGRGASALSEAAVEGHAAIARMLLNEHKLTNPNEQNHEGRTPLHRAAFQSRLEMISLLLEAGADPRIKQRSGETPYDLAGSDEARSLVQAWDVAKTDAILEARQKLVEAEEEGMVKTGEELKRLQRARQFAKLEKMIADGDKDGFDLGLLELQPGEVNSLRDPKGNSLLHAAASHNRAEICALLIDEAKAEVNSRDAKGWTPLMVGAFVDGKKACTELLARKADPAMENAYRKSSFDLAKTDEIKELLMQASNSSTSAEAAAAVASSQAAAPASAHPKGSAPSAKPRAKSKTRAKSVPKAAAKGKAKAKA
mmetsp:Transcript_17689/g.40998  ORF Transcript_17689/g.40998 Transcript_17689/m.40998 type:complete len:558 (-) Transcript_17689:67-1740(-)